MPRKLICFTVMVHGEYYRKGSRVHTVHAVSKKHAIRLLRAAKGFKLFRTMYVMINLKCDPQSKLSCCYKLVVQPEYGVTPKDGTTLSSLEQLTAKEIFPARQKLIDSIHKRRKDLFD